MVPVTLVTLLHPESRADLIKGAGIAAAYFGAARLGLALAFENSSITAVWPPTGIALAGLVLWGFRFWPAVALGAFLANSWTGLPLVSTLGITVGNTLEALVGAYLLVRVAQFRPSLDRVRDVFALVTFAAVGSTMVSATVGVTSLWIGGETTAGELAYDWQLWWLGDMGGDLIVAPLLFILATTSFLKPPPRRVLEGSVLVLFLFTTVGVAFSQETQVAYLVFPLLAWAVLRFGRLSAASAAFTVAAASIWFTARGVGPFAQGSPDDNLLLAQTFVGVAAAMSLLMAAFVAERSRTRAARQSARRARAACERAHCELEDQPGQSRRGPGAGPSRELGMGHRRRPRQLVGRAVPDLRPRSGLARRHVRGFPAMCPPR